MNITELDSFNLADAVKFHDRLNPRLWDRKEHLRPEVHAKLMEIAKDFQEFLGVPDLDVKDITVSGSNAAYNYTPNSDIDLHLVVDLPEADNNEVYRELFDAKKFQYNAQHNIRIGGYDVELYVQNPNQEHHSQGIYSLLRNAWTSVPKRRKADIDDISTRSKYEDLAARIDSTIADGDHDSMAMLMKKIKTMRQSGLEQNGEFGADNLAFKLLRNNGYIKKLVDARNAARDRELSLAEKAKPRQRITYGFVNESPDGVNPSTKMFLEEPGSEDEGVVRNFIDFVADRLGITDMPEIVLHTDPEWSKQAKSFGRYTPETHTLEVNLANRHIMDTLRTTAHELVHCRQNQERQLPSEAGATGSKWENQAHAIAGVIMRDYADQNPTMFESSGYIPTNAEKNDPRFKMALSVDVRPGQTGKEANKMALKTDAQGKPGLLMKTANLRESRMPQPSQGQGKYRDLNAPLGPEFKPTMPKGTVRVDVSDTYDWYKLGKHIPNLDRADASEFGKGPPSTIVSFGDENTEHKYIKDLEKLGLTTTDIDPVDPKQPKGMKRQKVDPTYNVAEQALAESLLEELALFEEDLFEVKMTSKNLAQLAKAIPGATVGLEFEMIVPNVNGSDGGDMEPNYAEDERVRDIDDCVNFFDDGDYNDRGTIRRLRADMEEAYFNWKIEQIDERWNGNQGWEFFVEYLDREEPFDEEDYLDQARDIVADKHPELEVGTDDYEVELRKVLDQINSTYYTDQWEEQGRNYDYAYEEFRDEMNDDISEGDWLDSQGIRYASDVESSYDVTWPYWDSPETETDSKEIALNFMNYMGYDTIAVGDYHGYGGGYQLWNGSEWVKIGSNKPMDAFTVEPDGSLNGDDSGDTGLEFVSPPIPLDQIGETMKKVQAWAGENGVYTGKRNSTSLHTNISIPGYDLDKLDYLKAAILLGDEHVLREFDRIGNTYAKPAIEKVKNLVQQKPEKAQELLDKMKSQLNAEASKLIHSGQTDKYTSINTKDNRIEFRSPGGDYLSIIADNPQKMIDTINRMVVVLDAAMDPNKYKEEYQKKLYKILTGQGGGREAKTGAKQEMKASDKDLLNIFSRYAAGELPKQALKSFVRQAQLERRGKKADAALASHNWAIRRRDGGDIVRTFQADDYMAAHEVYKQYKQKHNITDDSLTYGPYNPAEEKPEQQPEIPGSNIYRITTPGGTLIAGDEYDNDQAALRRAQYWAQHRNTDVVVRNARGEEVGRVSSIGDITPAAQQPAQTDQGNWGIWMLGADRFANQPGEYPRGAEVPLYRFPSREAAEQWIEQQRAERPRMRTDIEVREIEPREPLPDLFPELPGTPAAQQGSVVNYELYNRLTDEVIDTFPARNDNEAMTRLNDFRDFSALARQNPQWDVGVRQQVSSRAQQPTTQFGANTPAPMYEIVRNSDNEVVHRFFADSSDEAYEQASDFMIMQRWNPDDYSLQPADQAPAAPTDDWSAEFERRVTQPAASSDAAQGGLIDVPIEIPDTTPQQEYEIIGIETRNMLAAFRAANQAEAEQTAERMIRDVGLDPDRFDVRPRVVAQRPTTGQQQFTGEWKVVDPEGREIYRFGGVGNSQSDANRVAMQWLQRNPRHMQGGVEVLPVMG